MPKKYELKASDLRCICDPKVFSFKNTSEIEPLAEVIGQQRAVQAIEFGLNMKSPDYNIFVTGIEGTGKSTIIRDIVGDMPKPRRPLLTGVWSTILKMNTGQKPLPCPPGRQPGSAKP